MQQSFDVIVIGAGPAGEVAAGSLAERGKAVALVERELIGGECSFYACMPSKALLRPGELLDEIERVPGVAEASAGRGIDARVVLRRRDEVIHELSDEGQLPWLDKHGVTLLRGRARLAGERRVRGRRRRRARGARGGDRRDRLGCAAAADPRPRRGRAVDEPRGDDRRRGPRRVARARAAASSASSWRRRGARSALA